MSDPQREKQITINELVAKYVSARLKSDRLAHAFTDARTAMVFAEQEMQEAWRNCKHAQPGVYSFKEHGRLCVVVDPNQDYPKLTMVIQ